MKEYSKKRKGKKSPKFEDKDARTKKYENDASWYTRNSQLALDAGRLAYTWPTGAPINMEYPEGVTIHRLGTGTIRFPGVMELAFSPTYGKASSADDPLNISAFNIYSWVRHANSGHANYDAPDLMLYLMAMDSIYMYYQHMVRVYGAVRLFAQRNRNLPLMVFKALHVDYDDILANLADFRAYINVCALKIGSLVVPATMPLYVRHMWMASGIYTDSPSIKSQFYVFRPNVVGVYNERSSSNGGYLDAQSTNNDTTFAAMKARMDSMINAIVGSEDCNIMSGDIKKAYGDDQLFKLSQIGEDYMIEPVYSDEVLRQIQNATVVNTMSYVSGKLMEQDIDLGILKSSYSIRAVARAFFGKRIITGSSEDPSPEEVLVNSRLMVTSSSFSEREVGSNIEYDLVDPSVGTEVIVGARIYSFDYPEGKGLAYTLANRGNFPDLPAGTMENFSLVNFFNYHPMINWVSVDTASGTTPLPERVYPVFDVDNYAIIDNHDVEKLHNTALLSLLDVPQLGRVQG